MNVSWGIKMKLHLPWFPLIVTLIILAGTIYEHESAHRAVYEYKGYYNNSIGFDVGRGRAFLQNHDIIDDQDKNSIYLGNVMIDAVGYNLTLPLISIIMVILLSIWAREMDK